MLARTFGFMVVMTIAMALGLGEVFLIAVYVSVALGCLFKCERKAALLLFSAFVCASVLHFKGYKLFGAPQIHRTPPLENSEAVIGLEPPNVLRFVDNRSATLSGIYIPAPVDMRKHARRLSMGSLGDPRSDEPPKVRLVSESKGVVRAECQRRIEYWCGNTFFPTIFPRRLPTHRTCDFGTLLVSSGIAIPDEEEADNIYRRELIAAFNRSYACDLSVLIGRIPVDDPVATSMGRRWVAEKGELFVAGATLLVAAQDTESYREIETEILRRQHRNKDDYDRTAQRRSDELPRLLSWVNAQSARDHLDVVLSRIKEMRQNTLTNSDSSVLQAVLPLLAHGDFEELDRLVVKLDRERSPQSAAIARVLPRLFRWPEATSSLFQEWYWTYHPQLRLGRDKLGALAVSLNEGEPFDAVYWASLKQIGAID